jgi:hypothetical protein
MSPMLRFFWLAAIIAALAITLAAQQPIDPNAKVRLGDGITCTDSRGCICGNNDAPVGVGCQCQITLGSGTEHCPVGKGGGGPTLLQGGLLILVGLLIGSGLTYVVMRRRVTSP